MGQKDTVDLRCFHHQENKTNFFYFRVVYGTALTLEQGDRQNISKLIVMRVTNNFKMTEGFFNKRAVKVAFSKEWVTSGASNPRNLMFKYRND